jgi:hypothetical protein
MNAPLPLLYSTTFPNMLFSNVLVYHHPTFEGKEKERGHPAPRQEPRSLHPHGLTGLLILHKEPSWQDRIVMFLALHGQQL